MVDTIGNDLKQMQGSILKIGGLENVYNINLHKEI